MSDREQIARLGAHVEASRPTVRGTRGAMDALLVHGAVLQPHIVANEAGVSRAEALAFLRD